MRVVYLKKILSVIFIFTFFSLASAQEHAKNVRVGYPHIQGFSEGQSDSETKSGYTYEYLQKITSFAGWKYEYVYGDYKSLFEKLKKGEIDLLPQIPQTEQNAKLFLFPEKPMGFEEYEIYTNFNFQNGINLDNYNSLNNKLIGIEKESGGLQNLNDFLKQNNLSCKIVQFDSEEELFNNLMTNEVQAAVFSGIYKSSEISTICSIGQANYYFGITKNRPDLLSDMNNALHRIFRENFFYNETLNQKYFLNVFANSQLEPKETAWILGHQRIRVGYIENYLPYCSVDKKTGEFTGVFEEILNKIASKHRIEFIYVPFKSIEELNNALELHNVDIILPVYVDLWLAEKNNILLTNPIATAQMTLVYKGTYNQNTTKTFAITNALPIQKSFIESNYPDSQILYYDNFQNCLKAIKKGEANCTPINSFVMDNYRRRYAQISNLNSSEVLQSINVCLAVNRDDVLLLSILNKSLALIGQSDVSEALIKYTQLSSKERIIAFIASHLLLIFLLFIFFIFICAHFTKVIRKLLRENKNSRYDTLTGLLNRKTMDLYIANSMKSAIDDDKPFSFIMYDIDNFKKFNDTYGHDCGDLVLKTVSGVIANGVRPYDHVFRWGGEEILVLLAGSDDKIATMVAERIRAQVEAKIIQRAEQNLHVTVTGGIASYRPGVSIQDMIDKADKNLYVGKQNGKNQVVCS